MISTWNILEYTYSVLPMIFPRFVNANQFGSTEGFGITCDMNHNKTTGLSWCWKRQRLTFQSFSVPAARGARRTWPVAPAKPWPPDPNRFRASLLMSGDLVQQKKKCIYIYIYVCVRAQGKTRIARLPWTPSRFARVISWCFLGDTGDFFTFVA